MKRILNYVLPLFALLAIIAPFVFILMYAVLTPPIYEDTFVGVLDEKYERLNSVEGEKIVVIGGSSVAFGLDSDLLEKYTGMPVVNFGLYAALGTKLMLDLSLSGIGKGDVVVISPEMDAQTLSLFFNAETAWRGIEGNPSMLFSIGFDNISEMLGGAFVYAGEKLSGKHASEDESVYLAKYFDEYGDFSGYPRHENKMLAYYDTNTPIELRRAAYGEELSDFIDYLNKYIAKCRLRGAEVYFSYGPMNSLAISEASTPDERAKLCEYLESEIDCEFITELDLAIFDPGYFFDTNFHLNDAGMRARTLRLSRDLRLACGIVGPVVEDEPPAPELPFVDVEFLGYDENSRYFTYELLPMGAYAIVGLSDEGRTMESLTLPLGFDGRKVASVRSGALASARLKTVIISAESNLKIFENGAFLDTPALTDLWIYKTTGDAIAPPLDFYGTAESFRVHVPEGSDFGYHYYWSERGLDFVYDAVTE